MPIQRTGEVIVSKDLKDQQNAVDTEETTAKKSADSEVVRAKKKAKTASLSIKARSGNPAKRGEVVEELTKKKSAVAQAAQKAAKFNINPVWLVPTMLGLMIIGVLWIVIFYLTASIGGYPMPVLRYGNLAVGFGFIIVGFGLSTKWK
jgi:Flp pilus assembly protein TadB